jgi:hypothetical protein
MCEKLMNQLFPPEIIEYTAESHFSRHGKTPQILYVKVLLALVAAIGATPFIKVDVTAQSYIYKSNVQFVCGFYIKELSQTESKKVNAGFQISSYFQKSTIFFLHSQNLRERCANLADGTLHKC